MYCETCPIRDHCEAYTRAEIDNNGSYHSQIIVRVSTYSEPSCPLLKLIAPSVCLEVKEINK